MRSLSLLTDLGAIASKLSDDDCKFLAREFSMQRVNDLSEMDSRRETVGRIFQKLSPPEIETLTHSFKRSIEAGREPTAHEAIEDSMRGGPAHEAILPAERGPQFANIKGPDSIAEACGLTESQFTNLSFNACKALNVLNDARLAAVASREAIDAQRVRSIAAYEDKVTELENELTTGVSLSNKFVAPLEQYIEAAEQFRAITSDFPGLTGPLVDLFQGAPKRV